MLLIYLWYVLFYFKVENVRMVDRYNSKNPSVGTLYLTATHLIFVDPEVNKETWVIFSNKKYRLCLLIIKCCR